MSYILGNGTSSSKLKNFLYFRRELAKLEKQKITADLVCIPNVSNREFLGF